MPNMRDAYRTYVNAFNRLVYGTNDPRQVATEIGRHWDIRYGLWLPQQPPGRRR